MDLCVHGGHALIDGTVREVDIGVRNGRITTVGEVESADKELDATDCLVLPGLVNAHTHAAMTLLRGYADDLPLSQWLEERIWPLEALFTPDLIEVGTRLAALEMIRTGTTTFADMYFATDRVADVVAESGLRARIGYGLITDGKDESEWDAELEQGVAVVREYDGSADGRVRGMITPHAPYTCADRILRAAAEKATDLDCPLHLHLNETAGEVEEFVEAHGERPAQHLDALGCLNANTYVAHGVHLDGDEREHLSECDVCVAHCPSSNMKLASGAAPVTDLLAQGVNVCLGTDSAASNNTLDMFSEMRHAALGAKLREADATALPAETVLEMATRNGARALDLDCGVITEGRPADLTILALDRPNFTPRNDLLSHAVYAATGTDVTATVVAGEVLMEDGEVLTLDEQRVLAEAEETAARLRDRAEDAGVT